MGSTLRGKKEDDWEDILHSLENELHPKIDGVLKVGYKHLSKNYQYLFQLIACFFNYVEDNHVKAMLADSNMNVRHGLKTLAYKSFIHISTNGKIVMHKLLQQVGRENCGKQRILTHADEIRDVLEDDYGSTSTVTGISLDMTTIPNGECLSVRAFKRLKNLRFLNIYKTRFQTNARVHVPEDMEFPPRLRLLHWELYPRKCLPQTFRPEYLVELYLQQPNLEKLWEGTQLLPNLKKMDLCESMNLKELPDLSNATNLEILRLGGCCSLVEIPSSIGNLHKLEALYLGYCIKLQVVPTHFNLASLKDVDMNGCWQLRKIPDIFRKVRRLSIEDILLEDLPRLSFQLESLSIYGYRSVSITSELTEVSAETDIIISPEQSVAEIEKLPDWIKDLHGQKWLNICGCSKLASLPELPGSLEEVKVQSCGSLETVSFNFDFPFLSLYFINCFKLRQEARRVITNQSSEAFMPGRNIPVEFVHQAIGSSLTIRSSFHMFRICIVLSPNQHTSGYPKFLFRARINGFPAADYTPKIIGEIQAEHLFMILVNLRNEEGWLEHENEISFEFSSRSSNIHITKCGVQIFME